MFEAAIGTFLVSICDDSVDSGLKFTEMQVLVITYAYLMPVKDIFLEVAIFVLQASLPIKCVFRCAPLNNLIHRIRVL